MRAAMANRRRATPLRLSRAPMRLKALKMQTETRRLSESAGAAMRRAGVRGVLNSAVAASTSAGTFNRPSGATRP